MVAHSHESKLPEWVNMPLDLVAVAVGERVEMGEYEAVGPGWNHGRRAGYGGLGPEGIGIISCIGHHLLGRWRD